MSVVRPPSPRFSVTRAIDFVALVVLLASLCWLWASNNSSAVSPLYQVLQTQGLASKDVGKDVVKEEAISKLKMISARSKLELRSFVIEETIVQVSDKGKLVDYVATQLEQGSVLSSSQASRVLSMVELLPSSSALFISELGEGGSLRNSAVAALISVRRGKIHFALAASMVEPHLGYFGRIARQERNLWNAALSQFVQSKVRADAARLVAPPPPPPPPLRTPN